MEKAMIECRGLCKTYRVAKREAGLGNAVKALFSREYELVRALREVSFTVQDGEIVGYIGPNGAGKSTTIKTMCGILTPDAGECVINGRTPWKERKRHVREIGVVFGQRSQLWWDIPVMDSFHLLRDMYKIESVVYKRNLDELTELLGLKEILRTPVRNLSLGQRMRCEIAASLLHNPRILFLDEPTIGLDAVSKLNVRRFIKKRNREHGTTVILTTHDMQDIEALTERVLLIGKGKLLMDGKLDELKRHCSTKKTLRIKYRGQMPKLFEGAVLLEKQGFACGEAGPGEDPGGESAGEMKLSLDPQVKSVSAAIADLAAQTELLDVSVTDITAEEMVAELYEEYQI
jgi:ABC-2 type transport system ATP-binding protein